MEQPLLPFLNERVSVEVTVCVPALNAGHRGKVDSKPPYQEEPHWCRDYYEILDLKSVAIIEWDFGVFSVKRKLNTAFWKVREAGKYL